MQACSDDCAPHVRAQQSPAVSVVAGVCRRVWPPVAPRVRLSSPACIVVPSEALEDGRKLHRLPKSGEGIEPGVATFDRSSTYLARITSFRVNSPIYPSTFEIGVDSFSFPLKQKIISEETASTQVWERTAAGCARRAELRAHSCWAATMQHLSFRVPAGAPWEHPDHWPADDAFVLNVWTRRNHVAKADGHGLRAGQHRGRSRCVAMVPCAHSGQDPAHARAHATRACAHGRRHVALVCTCTQAAHFTWIRRATAILSTKLARATPAFAPPCSPTPWCVWRLFCRM